MSFSSTGQKIKEEKRFGKEAFSLDASGFLVHDWPVISLGILSAFPNCLYMQPAP